MCGPSVRPPRSRCPSQTMVFTLRHASSPPRAAALRAMSPAAVVAGEMGGCAAACTTPIRPPTRAETNADSTIRGMLLLLGARCGSGSELRLLKQRVAQGVVDRDPGYLDLAVVLYALNGGFEHVRNEQSVLGSVLAVIDCDVVLFAVEHPRCAVGLQLEETAGIDPQVALLAVAQRQLEFVGGVALDRLLADEGNLGALRGVIDQRPVQLIG